MPTASPEPLSRGEDGDEDVEEGGNDDLRQLSDQVLKERLQRLQDGLDEGFYGRLPDGGKKYRRLISAARREIARRQAARSAPPSPSSQTPPPRPHGGRREPNDGRCERIIQSRCAGSSGLASGSNENHGVTHSDFLAAFEVNEEAGIDVSPPGTTSTGPGKLRTSIENEGMLYEMEESCKTAAQPTYLSPEVLCIDNSTNMENMSPDDDCKDDYHSRICEHASTPSRKRKRDDSVVFSMRLRSRKVQEVVLLDGDARHSESAEKTSCKWDAMKIYYPSREHPNSVELSHDDIKCLEPKSLLSSPIMNFYIMYLQGPMSSISRLRSKYHIFNTYFFSKLEALTSKVDKASYFLKLRRWWKGIDIFQKAYILLPVHADTHWSLAVICMPGKEDQSGPIVLHLDSLKFHSSRLIFSVVERFLKEEWNYLNENGSLAECPIQEMVWKNLPRRIDKKSIADPPVCECICPLQVPQQQNEYDCGIFVLYYMQRFIEEAPERLHKNDLSMFGKGWFEPKEASALRNEMQTLLLRLFEEAEPKNNTTEPAMSEHPMEGSSAETTSPDPLESTSTQPTSFEHPLECS